MVFIPDNWILHTVPEGSHLGGQVKALKIIICRLFRHEVKLCVTKNHSFIFKCCIRCLKPFSHIILDKEKSYYVDENK